MPQHGYSDPADKISQEKKLKTNELKLVFGMSGEAMAVVQHLSSHESMLHGTNEVMLGHGPSMCK